MTNAEYIIARDNLIPVAEKFTDEKVGTSHSPGEDISEWAAEWSLTFINKMDEIAKERGLI